MQILKSYAKPSRKLESSSGDSGARAGGVNLTLMEAMDGLTDAVAKKDSRIQTLEGEIAAKTHQVRLAEQRAGQALGSWTSCVTVLHFFNEPSILEQRRSWYHN